MNVFISWSGERSKIIAEALRDWLPNVIQALRPWLSSEDIEKGARWSSDISINLEKTRFGIICLTPENVNEPWINFEAGALSKTLDRTYVCPCLFNLEPTDLSGPLVQFQVTKLNKKDVKKLVNTINHAQESGPLEKDKIERALQLWWPDLENRLKNIPDKAITPKVRPEREILEEILELFRSQTRKKVKRLSLFKIDDVRTWPFEKVCPKCGGRMTLDHDAMEYACELCSYWE